MKKEIPEGSKTELPAYALAECDRFLKNLERESQMIDDHGNTIIGKRDRQPKLDERE